MSSTEIVISSVRHSVLPSVRFFRPVWHLESWNVENKSVGVCVSIVQSGIWIHGLGVQDSGLNQDLLLRKYAFLSITWFPAINMEHVRAPSKGLSTRNVFCIGSMVICTCGLLLNPAKVPNFQNRAWLCSMDQKFNGGDEKTRESQFWDFA
jgi:hypothetical protein